MSETKSFDKKLLNKKSKTISRKRIFRQSRTKMEIPDKDRQQREQHRPSGGRRPKPGSRTSREVSIDNIERVEGVFQRERGEGEARDYGGRSK